jgi:hypothetical protein
MSILKLACILPPRTSASSRPSSLLAMPTVPDRMIHRVAAAPEGKGKGESRLLPWAENHSPA